MISHMWSEKSKVKLFDCNHLLVILHYEDIQFRHCENLQKIEVNTFNTVYRS